MANPAAKNRFFHFRHAVRLYLAPEILELLFSPKRIAEAKAFFFIFSRRWNMPEIKYKYTNP